MKRDVKDKSVKSDDAAVVRKCLNGDKGAFEELVERYKTAVYNLSYRMLSNREEAADVAQETFIKAYCSLGEFRGGAFSSWLLRIANNLCIDRLRRRRFAPLSIEKIRAKGEAASLDCVADVRRHELAADRRSWVESAVGRLPLKYRRVVVLHYFEYLSCEEIAGVLKCSANTVKTRLRRARQRLREELSAENDHELQAS